MPKLYPDPLRFNPGRWETIERSVYEFSPYGGGPRMCLGSSFAQQELAIALAMIVQRFHLELAPGTRVDRQVRVALLPKGGLPMVLY